MSPKALFVSSNAGRSIEETAPIGGTFPASSATYCAMLREPDGYEHFPASLLDLRMDWAMAQ